MMNSALATFPLSYSKTLQPFRAGEASALATGLGSVSLVNLKEYGLPSGKFVPQHSPERAPSRVHDGFCHPGLCESGGVHIADNDQTVLVGQPGAGDVEMVSPCVGDLGVDSADPTLIPCPLGLGELSLVLAVMPQRGHFMPVAACGQSLEAKVNADLTVPACEIVLDLALESDISAPASVLDEGSGSDLALDLPRLPKAIAALEVGDGILVHLDRPVDERNPPKRSFGAETGPEARAFTVEIAGPDELPAGCADSVRVQAKVEGDSCAEPPQIKVRGPSNMAPHLPSPFGLTLGGGAVVPDLIAGDGVARKMLAGRSVLDPEFVGDNAHCGSLAANISLGQERVVVFPAPGAFAFCTSPKHQQQEDALPPRPERRGFRARY